MSEERIKELENQLRDANDEIERLRDALAWYAMPEFYHAIAFWADSPAGGFADDFSEDHGHDFYDRPMPGKLAREVLKSTRPGDRAWMMTALVMTAAMAGPPMPEDGPLGHRHIKEMPERAVHFEASKLARWLGWAQAAVVSGGVATLEEMKDLNRRLSEKK